MATLNGFCSLRPQIALSEIFYHNAFSEHKKYALPTPCVFLILGEQKTFRKPERERSNLLALTHAARNLKLLSVSREGSQP
jgi:hypothetical protein